MKKQRAHERARLTYPFPACEVQVSPNELIRRNNMARPFKTVLCPIDFSTDSLTALDYAADFAKQSEGQLILMHVVDNPLTDFYGPLVGEEGWQSGLCSH
jgi:hypothetical protein